MEKYQLTTVKLQVKVLSLRLSGTRRQNGAKRNQRLSSCFIITYSYMEHLYDFTALI
jgi:hypothetical protein